MHPNFSLLLSIIHSFPLTYNSPSSSLFYQSSSLLLFLCLVLCDQFCTPAFVGAFRGSEFPNASLSFCMLTSGTRRLRRSFALASRDPSCASHHDHVSHSSFSPLSVICLHQGREREDDADLLSIHALTHSRSRLGSKRKRSRHASVRGPHRAPPPPPLAITDEGVKRQEASVQHLISSTATQAKTAEFFPQLFEYLISKSLVFCRKKEETRIKEDSLAGFIDELHEFLPLSFSLSLHSPASY